LELAFPLNNLPRKMPLYSPRLFIPSSTSQPQILDKSTPSKTSQYFDLTDQATRYKRALQPDTPKHPPEMEAMGKNWPKWGCKHADDMEDLEYTFDQSCKAGKRNRWNAEVEQVRQAHEDQCVKQGVSPDEN
jgi:hypothetical protein